LLLRFTAAVCGLKQITGKNEADRFAKCAVDADTLAVLGQLLTDVANNKKSEAVKLAPIKAQEVASHEHV
jgi:hypothetical protein